VIPSSEEMSDFPIDATTDIFLNENVIDIPLLLENVLL